MWLDFIISITFRGSWNAWTDQCQVVHSHNDYFASISFPAVAELAMRVNKLGKSSVTYEIALFEKGVDRVCSVGQL